MKTTIDRTLFWFSDGQDNLLPLHERFFALANLLNRLLSEKYPKKNITFINIYFSTEKTYELFPNAQRHLIHLYGGHFKYNDVFDLDQFNQLTPDQQDYFIWKRAFEILQESAVTLKNKDLAVASKYAYQEGLNRHLNPDFRLLEKEGVIHGTPVKASLWIRFPGDAMHSILTIEKDGLVVFEKSIEKARNGIEFFLEMYTNLEIKDNTVIIQGRKDAPQLPLKVAIEENWSQKV